MQGSNVFRSEPRTLKTEEIELITDIKNKAQQLYNRIDMAPDSREKALAKTKLEESIMWVVKGITQ